MSRMHLTIIAFVMFGALLTGCASQGQFPYSTRTSWSYATNTQRSPIATYGLPNTAVQMSLECDPAKEAIHIEFVDTEISEDRPIELAVRNVFYRGTERLDPPDGMAVSRITVPWTEAVLGSFAAGAGNIVVIAANERFQLPSGRLPQQMVRDCLNLRF